MTEQNIQELSQAMAEHRYFYHRMDGHMVFCYGIEGDEVVFRRPLWLFRERMPLDRFGETFSMIQPGGAVT